VPKLNRKRTILIKAESSYATDPTPTGAANAVLVTDLELTPLESDEVEREVLRATLGNFDKLLANQRASISFTVELAGNSDGAGTEPRFGPALLACGMGVATVSSTSNTYTPISSSAPPSCVIYCNYDGVLHKLVGCRGSWSLEASVSEVPKITFTMTGLYAAPTDTALPTCTYKAKDPVIFKKDNVTAFEIFGYAGACSNWSLDMANEIVYRELVGGGSSKEVLLTNRAPAGSLTVEAVALSAHNFFTDATGSSTGTNKFIHGNASGNKVEVSVPYSDLGAPNYSESDGITMLELPFTALPSSGNDEISLKFF
tara:strand:- start:481 stop:1422 length:942 start_codon:yes stop_codon:yes gene_type:complete